LLLATFGLVLALTSPAAAATLDVRVRPPEVDFGERQRVTGTLTEGTTPLAGQPLALEARRHPYNAEFERVATTTTAADGTYEFRKRFRRNHELRVVAPTVTSPALNAFVFPKTELSFSARNARVITLKQRYKTPRNVELRAPTRFYVGRDGAETGLLKAVADVEEKRPGRWVSKATIRIPAKWDGKFRYGSCFRYSPGSGMGDPDASCPKRRLRL
jgi:hypothetical protein